MSATRIRNVVILACAVDSADKALLPNCFAALSEQLEVGPSELGALMFAQSIAFSLALPMWGSMMQFFAPRTILQFGCFLWGALTVLVACTSSYSLQFVLRLLVGAALAVVNPMGQAIICDVVPESERGWSFGLLQSVSTGVTMVVSFVTVSISRTTIWGFQGWRVAHIVVATMSIFAGFAVSVFMPVSLSPVSAKSGKKSWISEQVRVVQLVANKPSFFIMVAQGVTGGIPWNAFSFLSLYLQLSGYTDVEAGQILLYGGFGGVLGGVLGGKLGDLLNSIWPFTGRCLVAQSSVLLGIFCFVWFMHVPEGSFTMVVVSQFFFHTVACWTPAAALRPICGEIVRNSQDRAQILSLWIALEGIVASFCGAPLAGVLSEAFGYKLVKGSGLPPESDRHSSMVALRTALVGVCVVPFCLCFLAWFPMYWTFPRDAMKSTPSPRHEYEMVNAAVKQGIDPADILGMPSKNDD